MIGSRKVNPAAIFIFFPILVYLLYAFINATNIFFADDFHLLKTVLWVQEANGLSAQLDLLIQQHNEHRILLPRLITLLDYQIEGAINWRTLIMTGSLIWVANIWFFWEGFKHFKMPAWMFIAVPFLFLQPQYTDNVTWAISILQQSVIVFWFSLLSYLCACDKYRWALLIAILATFTHGNGIFSFLIVILLAMSDRRWRVAMVCTGAWVIVGLIYFWDFRKGQSADFGKSLSDPVRLAMSFFAFFGSVTRIRTENAYYAVFLGFLLVAVLAIYLIPKLKVVFHRSGHQLIPFDKMLLGNVLFLGITGALVSVSRSWAGIASVLASRYQHYSAFVICWGYIVLLSFLGPRHRKMAAGICILFAVGFNAGSYITYREQIQFRKDGLTADESNWVHHQVMLQYAWTFNENIKHVYREAVARGICRITNDFPGVSMADSLASAINFRFFSRIIHDIDAAGSYPRHIQSITNEHVTGKTYLYLKSGKGFGYWVPTRLRRSGIMELIKCGRLYRPGFHAEFLTENLPPATYKIGILNNGKFFWSSKTIRIR